jgi:hypothetical protein
MPQQLDSQSQAERTQQAPPFLVCKPFIFCQFREEPRLQVVYTPDYSGATGAVLDLDELEQLEALIRFIKSAPKVSYPQTDEVSQVGERAR